jgi:hypothetical protein
MKGNRHIKGEVFVDLGCGFGRLINEYKDFDTYHPDRLFTKQS